MELIGAVILGIGVGLVIGIMYMKLTKGNQEFLEKVNQEKSSALKELTTNVEALRLEKETLNSTLAQKNAYLEQKREAFSNLNSSHVEISKNLKKMEERQQQRTSYLAKAEEKIQSLRHKIEDFKKIENKRDSLQEENSSLIAQKSQLETRLQEQQKQNNEKLKLLDEAKVNLKNEFQNLAQKIFEEKSEKFTEVNKHKLEQLIHPFREQIKDFSKKVDDSYDKDSKERLTLKQEILQLQQLNSQMSQDAINLTKALKGDVKTQGNWGELILERILEESGLRKGIEFDREKSFTNDNGRSLRPDVIVHLPDNKEIIVDSKVSLVAYERYCSASSDEERVTALAEHLSSVKSHIKGLSAKNYDGIKEINCLEYVLLFMPVEGAFRLALEADKNLILEASKQNIMLICPSTLLISLRTIYSLWKYQYQNINARKIADRAAVLYEKFAGFVEDVENIGKSLGRSQELWQKARHKLSHGPGNLVRQCEILTELGVKPKKQLKKQIRQEAELSLEYSENREKIG